MESKYGGNEGEEGAVREIKFRAWDEKEKCWIGGFSIHNSGMFSDWAGARLVNGVCIADANWEYPEKLPHIKIMQYTGLKDKNGREIYDGDVLEEKESFDEIFRHIVKWSDLNAGWMFDWCGECLGSSDISLNNCEVIGNIHQNPELLEVKPCQQA